LAISNSEFSPAPGDLGDSKAHWQPFSAKEVTTSAGHDLLVAVGLVLIDLGTKM
jgi:hypothetical protein